MSQIVKDLYYNFFKENWQLYILYLLTLVSLPLQKVAIPHYYGEIISSLKDNKMDLSKKYFTILLGIWFVIESLGIGISYVDNYIWPKFHAYVRQYFFDVIIDRYNQHFQELKLGEILTKLIKLPWILDDISTQIQRFVLTNSIVTISSFIYLFQHHYLLGIIYILSIGTVLLLSRSYFNTCNLNVKRVEILYDTCHEEIEDTLENLLSIYTSQKSTPEKKRVYNINKRTLDQQIKTGLCNRKYKIYFSIVNIILFVSLNYVSYRLYLNKQIKISSLVAIFILNYTILGSLMTMYSDAKEFMNIKSHLELIEEFFNKLPPMEKAQKKGKIGKSDKIDIRLIDIHYHHPGNEEKPIYKGLNLRIYPNQRIAIMGTIGSGKSTFAKLITRLQTHQKGKILINEIPIEQIEIDELRGNIVYIPQHPKLFNRTLWENISYGLPTKGPNKITPEVIYTFLHNLELYELEDVFKERMTKMVGKQGSHLSGGQRQMVWLIRAILRNCPVIILDEPTASLDPNSKLQVKKMIEILGKNRTLMMITHDEDLVDGMDRLIKFDKGKIIHDEKLDSK
jgi:ABC-type multidrug transport system fused ATPase/permease subunit